jgi:pyrimidine deaminase RibD-like protein/NTP pyrophosphatase (non-canonical NTP hydrolase)
MNDDDLKYMQLAIEQATQSKDEDDRVHPKVGAVVVKDNEVLAVAYRGEFQGEHAEFIALERKLPNAKLVGATVYTTLEPCTVRRYPKRPCAEWLASRKVGRVVVGTLDPNPLISGKGEMWLRERNIPVERFPTKQMAEIEELNRKFILMHRGAVKEVEVDMKFVEANKGRDLDQWYESLNSIYWNRNFYRDQTSIFAHLVEVIGGLSLLASDKEKKSISPGRFVPKALAWWLALCGKVGIRSVSELVWTKFPCVCPYCLKSPHDPDECAERKTKHEGPDWQGLTYLGHKNKASRPVSLGAWQRMFSGIYPVQQTEAYGHTFARLTEELGELAEALRTFSAVPGYYLSEAADVFAWLMHLQNLIEFKTKIPKENRGNAIEFEFCRAYPDRCTDCGFVKCGCPPILSSTVGRIAHEVPKVEGTFDFRRNFMSPDEAILRFQVTGNQ